MNRFCIILFLGCFLSCSTGAFGQDLLNCSFVGQSPATNLPWTLTDQIDPSLSFSGWQIGTGVSPVSAVDDALAFAVSAGTNNSTLTEAVQRNEYLAFTLTPSPGLLDLGGKEVQFQIARVSFWSPTQFSLFSSIDGFQNDQGLFTTAPIAQGDISTRTFTFIFPLTGYGNQSGPVEFRLYLHGARYSNHYATLVDFQIVDPGPVYALVLNATSGGQVVTSPPGTLFRQGSAVVLTANRDGDQRFAGWSGSISGKGNPRTITMTSSQTIQANFELVKKPSTGMEMGMNLNSVVDWTKSWTFVDQMKMSRRWLTRSMFGSEWDSFMAGQIPVGKNHWPTHLPFLGTDGLNHFVHTLVPVPIAGDYEVTVVGTGTVRFRGALPTLVVPVAGNTTFTITIPPTAGNIMLFEVRVSDVNDPIRDIRIIRPDMVGMGTDDGFHPLFLDRLKSFTNLRFMDLGRTNGSPIRQWSERTRIGDYTQSGPNGMALEHMVDLCNELDCDMWICIPHLADDDYIKQCARLVQDRLEPGLKVYVEYSNETWNSIFSQTVYCQSEGLARNLDLDGFRAGQKFVALRSVQMWEIFEAEFSNKNRLVKVMATQSSGSVPTNTRFMGLSDPSINPNYVMPDVLAIAPYFGRNYRTQDLPPTTASYPTVTEIVEQVAPAEIAALRQDLLFQKGVANDQGLDLVCYEAGQHFVGLYAAVNDPQLTSILTAANGHPGMFDNYVSYLDLLNEEGVALCAAFNYVGSWGRSGSWGAMQNQDEDLSVAHKYRALSTWRSLNLVCNTMNIRVGQPGQFELALNGGEAHGGMNYQVYMGLSGTQPGTTLPGGQFLPINLDSFSLRVQYDQSSSPFQNFIGRLDSNGFASASFTSNGSIPLWLSGSILSLSFLGTWTGGVASNPIEIQFTP